MTDPAVLTPPAATPTAAPTGPLADLLLTRLLPAKSSVSPKRLRDDVAPMFRRPPTPEQVEEMIATLRADGLVVPKGQLLTDAGRQRALAYLGVTELSPRAHWGTVKAKYLVPKALGLSSASAADAKTVGDKGRLTALLLKRKLNLPAATPMTLAKAFEAAVCQKLGFRDQLSLAAVRSAVTADLLELKRPGMDGLRALALDGLLADENHRPEPAEPFDLEAFANTVRHVARTCPTGRFGANKVFISHVWRQVQHEPRFAPLGLDGFKARLAEANRENLLVLSRADLVQVMDPADVRESETAYGNAVFHFILIEEE